MRRPGRPDLPGETLWRHPEFPRLWTAQTISLFGDNFTALAQPSTAYAMQFALRRLEYRTRVEGSLAQH